MGNDKGTKLLTSKRDRENLLSLFEKFQKDIWLSQWSWREREDGNGKKRFFSWAEGPTHQGDEFGNVLSDAMDDSKLIVKSVSMSGDLVRDVETLLDLISRIESICKSGNEKSVSELCESIQKEIDQCGGIG